MILFQDEPQAKYVEKHAVLALNQQLLGKTSSGSDTSKSYFFELIYLLMFFCCLIFVINCTIFYGRYRIFGISISAELQNLLNSCFY